MKTLVSCCLSALLLAITSGTHAATVFGNFEDNTTDGFGTLTNSGVTANTFSSPTTGTVVTPLVGGLSTRVLNLDAFGYNGGVGSGAPLGFDFAANGLTSAFRANNRIEFDWEVPASGTSSGYSQLYQFVLAAPGPGYITFGGSGGSASSAATSTGTVAANAPFNGTAYHVVIDYTGFKAALGANPSYIQFGITTNNGGGAPSNFYFDNFQLTGAAVPEPGTWALVAAGAGLLGVATLRRRTAL